MTHIEEILNRYWEGETSLEEERELRSYFSQPIHHIDDPLKVYQPLFMGIELGKEEKMPVGLMQRMNAHSSERPLLRSVSRRLWHWGASIAATVALLVIVLPAIVDDSQPQQEQYRVESPEEAYQEVAKALKIFSKGYESSEAHLQLVAPLNESMLWPASGGQKSSGNNTKD